MEVALVYLLILLGLSGVFALPVLRHRPGKKPMLLATLQVAILYLIPMVVFVLSAFLIPDWKGAAKLGWMDCFHTGKLALSPLVLWAVVASWVREIGMDPQHKTPLWIVLGHCSGALVASISFLVGLFITNLDGGAWLMMGIPLYTSLWFVFKSWKMLQETPPSFSALLLSLFGQLPLWATSLYWSYTTYQDLPDEPPDCFVVTAATRGHPRLVGPFTQIERHGRKRLANQQLLVFWAFEEAWRRRSPQSHALLRAIYNRLGPVVARRLCHPLLSDLMWLTLKPLEWLLLVLGVGQRPA